MDNNNFWCEKCGQALAVCDGEQSCSEARRRSAVKLGLMVKPMSIQEWTAWARGVSESFELAAKSMAAMGKKNL